MTDSSQGAPPKKGGGMLKLLLLACGGCFCLFAGFIGVVVGGTYMATAPAAEAARTHLQTAGADPAKAYAACSSAFKASLTEAQFKTFVDGHPELYKTTDITFNQRKFENNLYTIEGTVTPAAGGAPVPVTVELVKEGDAYRVQSVENKAWVPPPQPPG